MKPFPQWQRPFRKFKPIFLFLFWLMLTLELPLWAMAAALTTQGLSPQGVLQDLLQRIDHLGVIGAIVFIGVYSVATVAFVPGSLLTLGAGVLFGVVQGSIVVFIGATIGATLAFLIGRYGARGFVSRK